MEKQKILYKNGPFKKNSKVEKEVMTVNIKFLEFQQILFNLFKSQDPENGKFDIVFEVEGKKIYAYKVPLLVLSSTFDSMLSDRWNKKKDEPISIFGYSFDDFYQFLTFLYSGQCELTDKNINALVDIAEYYQVGLLKTYCDEYLSKITLNFDNVFQLLKLGNKYSLIKLKSVVKTFFIENYVDLRDSGHFLNVKKEIFAEIIHSFNCKISPENLFQDVYQWAEKEALDKQTSDPNCNQNDAIKNEISDFLPYIAFKMMDLKFFNEFVVPRGFIFSTHDELGKILNIVTLKPDCKVTITNNRGQILRGNLISDSDKILIETIISLRNEKTYGCCPDFFYWRTRCKILSSRSSLKKRDGVEWYLFCFSDGDIAVGHHTVINENRYLLAELVVDELTGFRPSGYCEIEIE